MKSIAVFAPAAGLSGLPGSSGEAGHVRCDGKANEIGIDGNRVARHVAGSQACRVFTIAHPEESTYFSVGKDRRRSGGKLRATHGNFEETDAERALAPLTLVTKEFKSFAICEKDFSVPAARNGNNVENE